MELKRDDGDAGVQAKHLLIEPVWNWNCDDAIFNQLERRTFNRTSMELKRDDIVRIGVGLR